MEPEESGSMYPASSVRSLLRPPSPPLHPTHTPLPLFPPVPLTPFRWARDAPLHR
jgi:hypothetical protein